MQASDDAKAERRTWSGVVDWKADRLGPPVARCVLRMDQQGLHTIGD
jgi:hypothetical protein